MAGSRGYGAAGNRTSATDPRQHATAYAYDALNRLITQTDALDGVTEYAYDAAGNLTGITDPRDVVTRYGYDAAGRVISQTLADGTPVAFTTAYGYDAADRLTSVTRPGNRTTAYGYDAAGRLTVLSEGVGTALQRASAYGYDAAGNLTSATDPLGHATAYAHDALGRLLAETDPRGGVTAYAYDAAGNLTGLTDPAGNATAFAYDALGRVTAETDPLGGVTAYGYDGAGRLASVTDPLLRQRAYGYDALGRVTSERWHAPGGALVQEQTFSYDANDNLLTATDPDGGYAITYDELDRPVQVQEPFGLGLAFAYDAAGNRTQVTDSRGGVTTSAYDALGRLTAREQSVNGQPSVRATWGFSPEGDATGEARQSWSGSAWQTVGTTERTFDALGRLTDLTHRDGGGVVLANYVYGYDAADRLTSETIDGVTRTYGYDAANQLTSDNGAALGYDANGNRTNAGYVTGPGNRLLSDGTWTYTYDAAGNLTKKSQGANAETWTYAYDHEGRLVSASRAPTDGGTADATVAYSYDAFGNRIGRDEWSASGGPQTERFGYDGWDTAKPPAVGGESFDAWADLDGSGALTMRRLFGAGFDDLVAGQDGAGNARWYLADRLGSVRQIADGAGAVVGTRDYGAFGQLVGGSGVEDRYGYAGREWDAALGLQYTRARMYDPATGRFTSADPVGFAAGDPNLYRYVGNGPTNATDPSGMYLVTTLDGAGADWVNWLTDNGIAFSAHKLPATWFHTPRVYIYLDESPENREKFWKLAKRTWSPAVASAVNDAAFHITTRNYVGNDRRGFSIQGFGGLSVQYLFQGKMLSGAEKAEIERIKRRIAAKPEPPCAAIYAVPSSEVEATGQELLRQVEHGNYLFVASQLGERVLIGRGGSRRVVAERAIREWKLSGLSPRERAVADLTGSIPPLGGSASHMARPMTAEQLAKVEQKINTLVQRYGRLPESDPIHQAVVAKAKEMGFSGPVIVFEKAPPNTGASMQPNDVLTIAAETWTNGFSRFGTHIPGDAAVAHEVAHLSPNLPEPYLQANAWKLKDPATGLQTGEYWRSEAAVSRAAAHSPFISQAAKQQLLQDAVQCEKWAPFAEQELILLTALNSASSPAAIEAARQAYEAFRQGPLKTFSTEGK